jgi:hypothetical protein
MYILVKPDQTTVYPYAYYQLIRDNPSTSFRPDMTDSELAQWGMFPVIETPDPAFDPEQYKVVSSQPELVNRVWVINKTLVPLTEDELADIQLEKQNQINIQNKEYLSSTDWYVIRQTETGVEIPMEISMARSDARAAIIETV